MKRATLSAVLFFLAATVCHSEPMTFELVGTGGNCAGCEWIKAEGEITSDTPAEFSKIETYRDLVVALNSPGGDLAAGMELGRMFRERGVSTNVARSLRDDTGWWLQVPSGAACESACAYAFLGGEKRFLEQGSRLGFHQFFDPTWVSGDVKSVTGLEQFLVSARDQYVTGKIVEYLIGMEIDTRLYSLASSVGPSDPIHYVTSEEATRLGVDNATDALGEWRVLAFGEGLLAEAETQQSGRVVRLYCSNDGNHYLTYLLPPERYGDANHIATTYRRHSNNQIDLSVDEAVVNTRVEFVGTVGETGQVVVALAVDADAARRIAKAKRVYVNYERFLPPSVVRGTYYQPLLLNRIDGDANTPMNAFRLCI